MKDLDRPIAGRNYFLVMWSREGLESIIDLRELFEKVDEEEKQYVFEVLKNQNLAKPKSFVHRMGAIVNAMTLRARFNGQRFYEIYTIMTDESISFEEIKSGMNEDPQVWAETIRSRGVKIFGEPLDTRSDKITR